MSSKFGKVAVMLGGTSAEREVSLRSGAAVLAALQKQGVDAHAFDPKDQPLSALTAAGFDRVFIVLHGRGGEDGTMQGALQLMGLPYTGSRVLGSALAMDKIRCKWLFQAQGLPTAEFLVAEAGKQLNYQDILQQLAGKVMVKPANEGSSIGMSAASTAQELEQALAVASKYDADVLVEQWIQGREFTVTVLNGQALPVVEMRTPRSFYDYEAKYQSNSTEYLCPAPLTAEQTAFLQQAAVAAFTAVGASGWGRVDAMLDELGNFYLLEVNTVPGMTEKSLVPMAAKAAGLSFEQLVLQILEQTV
ncbi:MAG: D-alanine--D-alanine ligase [Gammaproteobacteria bacterium]|nr:D-alanine--D-alanine ligase [Gammaproteobacteria bacterium]MBU2056931.1 D-alanine--D-alanine ligase [Gammaproteobacteria bacterium]MBU2174537.1 D-alanine--D-alanine ligase [Gammaproteobacteria bacterium]MBU2248229.1 D-alanine--D-alanine ligase [Gammaproteobacteria bacterium]MBU2343766.1 D-alanine--D-alanine ligase [Gammaproteobacteria bacterium]